MSGAADREAVFPTRQSLGIMKAKLKGAETGHKITRRIDEAKRKMGRVMQIAAFSLAEVTYAVGGDIGYQVQESAKSARFRVRTKQDNVSGVLLPAFESYLTEGNNDFGLTGLGKGGQQVQRCRETYARAVEALVELASLQTAFVILDEVIKVVNRRVFVVTTSGGIYRVDTNNKKVANKKQRDTAAADAEMKAKREAQAEKNVPNQEKVQDATGPTDLLAAEEDDDVIF
ncbi:H(+)-transporting V1 sector ATPase subunit D [Amphichorda felina]